MVFINAGFTPMTYLYPAPVKLSPVPRLPLRGMYTTLEFGNSKGTVTCQVGHLVLALCRYLDLGLQELLR
ncbi:hypothetical protein LINPERHAP1_LOCUS16182 [Linum perenne]